MNAKLAARTVLGSLALFLVAAAAQGQTRNIFHRISTNFSTQGYTRIVTPVSGWLEDGESSRFSVWLAAGEGYAIAASCDRDCSDLDLQLFAPNGDEMARDLASDDEPVVVAEPMRTGRYEVRVSMASCTVEPCEYVAGVFKR